MARWLILAMLAAALGVPALAQDAGAADWQAVSVPDQALGIVAHGGELWAVGAEESIEVSRDGGRSWSAKHRRERGEMLFAIAFVDPSHAYAFGSGGARLESRDGGNTWRDGPPSMPIDCWTQVIFADASTVIAGNSFEFAISHDAGRNWAKHGMPEASAAPDQPDHRRVLNVAARDPEHLAVLFAAVSGERQPLVYSSDGGRTWGQVMFPAGTELAGLRAAADAFEVYGSAAGANIAATSPTGAVWTNVPAPPRPVRACGLQGCFGAGLWTDMQASPPLEIAAATAPTASAWARAGDGVCRIVEALQCLPIPTGAPTLSSTFAADPPRAVHSRGCNECELPVYPTAARRQWREGAVYLRATIEPDGSLTHLWVTEAAWADMAQAALAAVAGWRFRPVLANGLPIAAEADITVNFALTH